MIFDKKKRAVSLLSMQVVLLLAILLFPLRSSNNYTGNWINLLGFSVFGLCAVFFCLSLLKLGKSVTPSPIPKEDGKLVTSGFYRFARHPVYTSLILGALGWSAGFSSRATLVLSGLLAIVLFFKSKLEEEFLIEKYGEKYLSYMRTTGRFFPFC